MKKNNLYFIGECVIIILLLLIIGILIQDKSDTDIGRKANNREESIVMVGEDGTYQSNMEEYVEEEHQEAEDFPIEEVVNQQEEPQNVPQNQIKSVHEAEEQEEQLRVVVFGDSIWNEGRGIDGISEQVMAQTNVKIYNCAIGGTTAAVINESTAWNEWTSKSFNGMMYIANGAVDADDLIPDEEACEIIKTVDFSTIDYVIVSYGLNDYFSDVPIYPKEYYDVTSYVGALRHGITKLKEAYPNLEIILTSPTYCGWFKGERQFELGTYVENARGVAEEMGVYFLDMYHALGKNPEEKIQYLEDGVHLTTEGRTLYANSVITMLNELDNMDD